MPSLCYVLVVDDRPVWMTPSKRQACDFADPYIADHRKVHIRLIREHTDLAEWQYDHTSAQWREAVVPAPRSG